MDFHVTSAFHHDRGFTGLVRSSGSAKMALNLASVVAVLITRAEAFWPVFDEI